MLACIAACTDVPREMPLKRAEMLARMALAERQSRELFARKGVDIDRLPAPRSDRQDDLVLVEFRYSPQNISIVVIVKPDGGTEITSMTLDR